MNKKSYILVINSGSTSLKYKVFDLKNLEQKTKGYITDIGQGKIKDHRQAFRMMLREVLAAKVRLEEIKYVGHRVVHGGTEFVEPLKINEKNLKELEKYNELAPLHNPANLAGIKASQELFEIADDYACFDTAFYKDLPRKVYTYPLPMEILKKSRIRKFGFHGISHSFIAEEAAFKLGKPLSKCNLITIHLGGGASMTAVEKGKAVETSMGFTPVEGLMMMTRSGDFDPAILIYLQKHHGFSADDLDQMINHQSGIKGIAKEDNMLKLYQKVSQKKELATLAFDMYCHRIKKYLGAYLAILGKVDAVVFSGQIGSGKPILRQNVLKGLRNTLLKEVKIMTIETNEELMIARLTKKKIESQPV